MKKLLLLISMIMSTNAITANDCQPLGEPILTLSDYKLASIEERGEYKEIVEAMEAERLRYANCMVGEIESDNANPIVIMSEIIDQTRNRVTIAEIERIKKEETNSK